MLECDHGSMVLRHLGGLSVGLVSRGSMAMLDADVPKQCLRLFTAETSMQEALRARGFVPLRAPAEVAEWTISGSAETLRKRMRKTWRHDLDAAEHAGLKLSLTHMPTASDHWLLLAEQAQARAKRYRGLPLWLTRAWATLHAKDTLLIEARSHGVLVAGMVFLRHGDVASYQISQTTPLGRQLGAHRRMLWRAAEHFAQCGVSRLDLGTIDRVAAPGLAQFKLGTGAQPRRLGGTWVCVPGLAGARRQLVRQFPFGKKA